MKYLVIGGCGFIGTNFVAKLIQDGNQVTVCDNLSRKGAHLNLSFLLENYRGRFRFQYLDIRTDLHTLRDLMETVDVVFHLAAQVAVTTSVNNPVEDFQINALGTFNVLEAVRLSARKPALIYASTNKVYGEMEELQVVEKERRYEYASLENGVSERQPLDFHSPYGCSKGTGDQYVIDYSRIYGLRTVVYRQSCIYGPRQFGVEDQGWIAWFAIAAHLGKTITIYGDGKQVRDVLFISDLFDLWQRSSFNMERLSGQAFNIGGGTENTVSLLEVIEMLQIKLGKKINTQTAPWRPGDQKVYVSDIRKVAQTLGWKPRVKIEEGLDSLLNWIRINERDIRLLIG